MKIKQRRKNRPFFDLINGLSRVRNFIPEADSSAGGANTEGSPDSANLEAEETPEEKAERLERELATMRELNKQNEDNLKKAQNIARNATKQALAQVPEQLAGLSKINEAIQHLGLKIQTNPQASLAENYQLFNDTAKEEFKLNDYVVGEEHDKDFQNILSRSKKELMARKTGAHFAQNLPEGEVDFQWEGNAEIALLMKRQEKEGVI